MVQAGCVQIPARNGDISFNLDTLCYPKSVHNWDLALYMVQARCVRIPARNGDISFNLDTLCCPKSWDLALCSNIEGDKYYVAS